MTDRLFYIALILTVSIITIYNAVMGNSDDVRVQVVPLEMDSGGYSIDDPERLTVRLSNILFVTNHERGISAVSRSRTTFFD